MITTKFDPNLVSMIRQRMTSDIAGKITEVQPMDEVAAALAELYELLKQQYESSSGKKLDNS